MTLDDKALHSDVNNKPEGEGTKQMPIIRVLAMIFMLPGDVVRRLLGLSVEKDGGLIRSFVNQAFWGTVAVVVALRYYI